MGLFDSLRKRRKSKQTPGTLRKSTSADVEHLTNWAAQRRGVEAFVEPETTITDTTVVLIAHDGEWTRRRIGSLDAAQQFGIQRSIPVYEVAKVGYPQRYRDYLERQKVLQRREREQERES